MSACRSSASQLLQVPRTNLRFDMRSFRVHALLIPCSHSLELDYCLAAFVSANLYNFTETPHLKTFFSLAPPSDPACQIQFFIFGALRIELLTYIEEVKI